MSEMPIYELVRTFDAPPELVWKSWTDPELLTRWYGPNVETIVHGLDLKPGGLWKVEMRWGDNSHYQRVEYVEVSPPSRLVWLHSSSDGDWNITPSPMMPDWPRVLLTDVNFERLEDGQTRIHLAWTPHEATEAEVACFAGAMEGMGKGWGAGMELLAGLLQEIQAG